MNENKEKFDRIASVYDANRRNFIPCYDDFYGRAVSLLKCYRPTFRRVVDLGAGTGLLTESVRKLYPEAEYTLIDLSREMLAVARQRFADAPNVKFVEADYVDNIPSECDLICSALSIHHLDTEGKRRVYRNIYDSLLPGGCLLALDQFDASSAEVNRMYLRWWLDYIDRSGISPEQRAAWLDRKRTLDRENTVPETLELMRSSGFQSVECIYRFMKFGVLLGIKMSTSVDF